MILVCDAVCNVPEIVVALTAEAVTVPALTVVEVIVVILATVAVTLDVVTVAEVKLPGVTKSPFDCIVSAIDGEDALAAVVRNSILVPFAVLVQFSVAT